MPVEDPLNKKKKLVGLLLEEESEARINPALKLLHYVRQSSPDWFVRLCAALELEREDARLEFMAEPEDTFINHGLSPIKVAIRRGDGIVNCEDEITMRDQLGFLQGETTVRAREGVAEFKSLSVSAECSGNCLIASSRGCEDRQGRAFSVRNKVIAEDLPRGRREKGAHRTQRGGALLCERPRFGRFRLGHARRVPRGRLAPSLRQADRDGRAVPYHPAAGRFHRLYHLGRRSYSVECGRLLSRHQFRLPGRYMVPCGLSEEAGSLYAGFANGRTYRRKDSGEMRHYMTCKGSLQRMAAADGVLYVCDFEGNLTLYRDLQELKAFKVDRDVRAMEAARALRLHRGRREPLQAQPQDLGTHSFAARARRRLPRSLRGNASLPCQRVGQGFLLRFGTEHHLRIPPVTGVRARFEGFRGRVLHLCPSRRHEDADARGQDRFNAGRGLSPSPSRRIFSPWGWNMASASSRRTS